MSHRSKLRHRRWTRDVVLVVLSERRSVGVEAMCAQPTQLVEDFNVLQARDSFVWVVAAPNNHQVEAGTPKPSLQKIYLQLVVLCRLYQDLPRVFIEDCVTGFSEKPVVFFPLIVVDNLVLSSTMLQKLQLLASLPRTSSELQLPQDLRH